MTAPPAEDPDPVQPIAELFTRSASALWATTYNVDLALVNEFLLPRLGATPLNVTVLADGRRLARSLAQVGSERVDTLAAVNRRWLLRGVRPAGPAFHPKSYLAVTARTATLLVGSGNLSLGGLDEGREVFTTFRSGTADGDRAIATWRSWVRRLVRQLDDVVLTERFADLEQRLPAPGRGTADGAGSVLLHNLDTPFVDQLTAVTPAPGVDELHLAAPFYDRDAEAVARLVRELAPHRVTVYLGATTSVDGRTLRGALAGRDVRFCGLEPDEFTHAKLVGVVVGDRGWLLSGSANLSRVALLRSVADRGNVELAVLTSMSAELVRRSFVPPGAAVVERAVEFLDGLAVDDEEEPPERAVRLLRAEALDDGRVMVVSAPRAEPDWLLADGDTRHGLVTGPDDRATTRTPVAGRLVRLVDREDSDLSDPVIVDDVAALAGQLGESGPGAHRNAPPELTDADLDTPLGRALTRLHRELVMDVAERADAAPGAGRADADDAADDEFWERLLREHLADDPRAVRYRQLHGPGRQREALEELLAVLGLRIPSPARAASGPAHETDGGTPGVSGSTWSSRARLRVRARNVLRRWAAALTDPRLLWIDPHAPEVNFTAMVTFVGRLRLDAAEQPDQVELTDADLDEIWWWCLTAFVGTGRRDGYLDQLAAADADECIRGLDPWVGEWAAWLCWLAIRPGGGRRMRVIRAQSVLTAALDHGLLAPTDLSAQLAEAVAGGALTKAGVEEDLLSAAAFVDDDLWCAVTAEQLELTVLRFERSRDLHTTRTVLHVGGLDDPLRDPRTPHLLVEAERYRDSSGIVLRAVRTPATRSGRARHGADWRLIHTPSRPLEYLESLSDDSAYSLVDLDSAQLKQLVTAGTSLITIFADDDASVGAR